LSFYPLTVEEDCWSFSGDYVNIESTYLLKYI